MTEANVQAWLAGDYDEASKAEVRRLQAEDPEGLTDAFYRHLEFGTGGLRGLVGVGTNRVNVYTIRAATQGLANYLGGEGKVLISYDSRRDSRRFAEEAASVLAGNGIHPYVFKELRPTPLVSFGCRHLGCSAAIMITASHNPPDYNGYKVYWSHGGQVLPPHDKGIIAEVEKITSQSQVKRAQVKQGGQIEWIGDELDHAYLEATAPLQTYPEQNRTHGKKLRIVYTSLHGTGITLAPASLNQWGFTDLQLVEKQCVPDGDFPTAKSPNPEEASAMEMGSDQLQSVVGDLLIATDPDADRMGVAVRHKGEVVLLTGNQIASLCLHHLCASSKLPAQASFVKTIVTTELMAVIANHYGFPCFNVLTGFKYIGQLMEGWDPANHQYIFGAEESYGYLLGTHARDKDAIVCSSLIAEVALDAKLKGETLVDRLYSLYDQFGIYREALASQTYTGKAGAEKMAEIMERLRHSPPKKFAGIPVTISEDYLASTRTEGGQTTPLTLPISNVLLYWLADGSRLVIRPSGTEPKIKFYIGIKATPDEGVAAADARCKALGTALKEELS